MRDTAPCKNEKTRKTEVWFFKFWEIQRSQIPKAQEKFFRISAQNSANEKSFSETPPRVSARHRSSNAHWYTRAMSEGGVAISLRKVWNGESVSKSKFSAGRNFTQEIAFFAPFKIGFPKEKYAFTPRRKIERASSALPANEWKTTERNFFSCGVYSKILCIALRACTTKATPYSCASRNCMFHASSCRAAFFLKSSEKKSKPASPTAPILFFRKRLYKKSAFSKIGFCGCMPKARAHFSPQKKIRVQKFFLLWKFVLGMSASAEKMIAFRKKKGAWISGKISKSVSAWNFQKRNQMKMRVAKVEFQFSSMREMHHW